MNAEPQKPDPQFLADLRSSILAGLRPAAAARELGVKANVWKNWCLRQGDLYDALRGCVKQAVADLDQKLLTDLGSTGSRTTKNPRAAVKHLQRADDSPDRARYLARMAQEKPWELLGLTMREELFCREVVRDPKENGVAAIKRVGLFDAKTHRSQVNLAAALRKQPKIQTRIAQLRREELATIERRTRTKVDAQRVLEELTAVGLADIRRLVTVDEHGMSVKPSEEWRDEDAAAVAAVHNTPDGVRLVMHPKLPALVELSRITMPSAAASGGMNVRRAVIIIPDNGRDPLAATEGSTNGQHSAHREPESDPPGQVVQIDLPPRDVEPGSANGTDPGGDDDVERDLGLR